MPTFSSVSAIEDYIGSKCADAVKTAQTEVHNVIDKYVAQYYDTYDQRVYKRTDQLYNAIQDSAVYGVGKGYGAEVYADSGELSYRTEGVETLSWTGTVSATGDAGKVLSAAMSGFHGNHKKGVITTQIADLSIKELNNRETEILKTALITAGIPVK